MSTLPQPQLASIHSGIATAPLLVLMHGFTDNAASLSSQQAHWDTTYDVVAVDSRGHGLSPAFTPEQLDNPFETIIADYIEFLDDLLVRTGHEKAVLVGHSMGGAICSKVAALRPDLVRALLLEEPAWLSEKQRKLYRDIAAPTLEHVRWIINSPIQALSDNRRDYPTWPLAEACAWQQAKAQVDQAFVACGEVAPRDSWKDLASAIAVPTLVITSDGSDVLLGPSGIEAVDAVGNPNIRTALVPGARHCVRRECEELYHQQADAFLNEVAPARA